MCPSCAFNAFPLQRPRPLCREQRDQLRTGTPALMVGSIACSAGTGPHQPQDGDGDKDEDGDEDEDGDAVIPSAGVLG